MHQAGDVDVDAKGCCACRVLGRAGVLADPQSQAPPVDLQERRPVAGAEVVQLAAAEPGLAVGDLDACRVDPEHRYEADPVAVGHQGADQRHRPSSGAGFDDRLERWLIERGYELDARAVGQRQLGKDDHSCLVVANRLGMDSRVAGYVIRSADRFAPQRLSVVGAYGRSIAQRPHRAPA